MANQIKKWEDFDELVLPDGTTINMLKLLEEQDRAKAALSHIEPFFAGLIGKLRFIYTFHIDTQATDGYNIFVNPLFTSKLTLEQKVFVMAHEIMHCVLNHLRRGRALGHDMQKSNIAADYEVNTQLVQMGITSESIINAIKGLYDKKYNSWGYEKIYDDKPRGPQSSGNNQLNSGSRSGNNQPNSNSQSNGNNQSNSGSQSNGNNQSNSSSGDERTDPNNKNKGIVKPNDMTTDKDVNNTHNNSGGTAGGFCDKQDGNKLAEQEGYDKDNMTEEGRANDWKDAAMKNSSKLTGTGTGEFKAKLEGLYKVSTDWKKALRNIVGRSLNPEDKRQAFANKNVLISQDRIARTDKDKYNNMDYICCFIDSSGSMSDQQLKLVLTEVYHLALQKKPIRLFIIQCDTRIQDVKEYTNIQQLKKDTIHAEVKGRGGTDLKPCWELLKTDKRFKGRRAELVLCFTDGYLEQYKRDIRTMQNLVWCFLDNPSCSITHKDSNTKALHFKTNDIK